MKKVVGLSLKLECECQQYLTWRGCWNLNCLKGFLNQSAIWLACGAEIIPYDIFYELDDNQVLYDRMFMED